MTLDLFVLLLGKRYKKIEILDETNVMIFNFECGLILIYIKKKRKKGGVLLACVSYDSICEFFLGNDKTSLANL